MPSALPVGDPVPEGGPLFGTDARPGAPLSIYVHVPFCTSRCGYCDFNTYTSSELGPGASPLDYADAAIAEVRRAAAHIGAVGPVRTVFIGGGTPTLLPPADLGRILDVVRDCFGLATGAEVTTEANPESVDAQALDQLVEVGFTRISFGMQSADKSVPAVLDRHHAPGRPQAAVAQARAAGFGSISLDVIYGTPGESDESWEATALAALDAGVDHISAYALIVEPGTALGARVARGELAAPDDDVLAARYERADDLFTGAGLQWYEVSNWARPGHECQHNAAYWLSRDWWGIGPGAHSHVDGVRWWNVKHPAAYARALADGAWPAAGREVLSAGDRAAEDLMLRLRLREGVPLATSPAASDAVDALVADGLADASARDRGVLGLTRKGRLLADGVAARVLADDDARNAD